MRRTLDENCRIDSNRSLTDIIDQRHADRSFFTCEAASTSFHSSLPRLRSSRIEIVGSFEYWLDRGDVSGAGRVEIVTSALTLLEVLVVPYRASNVALAERYEAVLSRGRGIRMVNLGQDQLRRAAQLRASTGVATPDALQLAAALVGKCSTFVTNDRRLPSGPDLKILQLSSYRR